MNKYMHKLFSVMFQNQQTQQDVHVPPQHSPTSPKEWRKYWQAQGFPWRTEQEMDREPRKELAQQRAISAGIKGVRLSGAAGAWFLLERGSALRYTEGSEKLC